LKNNKKFIYLISPNVINEYLFYKKLIKVFRTNKISHFQLRLKNTENRKIIIIGKKLRKICNHYKVKLVINDNPKIAKIVNADGCHLGQKDVSILKARKILKNKIIGITCHNSLKLVKKADNAGADYLAIGAFFKSHTKKVSHLAKISLIKKTKSITKLPVVVIGGLNEKNYSKLLLHKPKFLAISGYVWNNKNDKPDIALKKIRI